MLVLVFRLEYPRGLVKVPGAPVLVELNAEMLTLVPNQLMLMSFPSGTMKVKLELIAIVAVMLPFPFKFRLTVPITVFAGTVPHDKPQFAFVIFNTTGEASTAGALANRIRARHVMAGRIMDFLGKHNFDLFSGINIKNLVNSPLDSLLHSKSLSRIRH